MAIPFNPGHEVAILVLKGNSHAPRATESGNKHDAAHHRAARVALWRSHSSSSFVPKSVYCILIVSCGTWQIPKSHYAETKRHFPPRNGGSYAGAKPAQRVHKRARAEGRGSTCHCSVPRHTFCAADNITASHRAEAHAAKSSPSAPSIRRDFFHANHPPSPPVRLAGGAVGFAWRRPKRQALSVAITCGQQRGDRGLSQASRASVVFCCPAINFDELVARAEATLRSCWNRRVRPIPCHDNPEFSLPSERRCHSRVPCSGTLNADHVLSCISPL